jgi:hypothetical protein
MDVRYVGRHNRLGAYSPIGRSLSRRDSWYGGALATPVSLRFEMHRAMPSVAVPAKAIVSSRRSASMSRAPIVSGKALRPCAAALAEIQGSHRKLARQVVDSSWLGISLRAQKIRIGHRPSRIVIRPDIYFLLHQPPGAEMADETFEEFIRRERERLNAQRQAIFQQQQELDNKLADIDRELSAIEAYEVAKTGKAAPRGTSRAPKRNTGARRGSRREELLNVIREHHGLTRGQILEKLGLKGDKSGEMSISNALTALTKSNQLRRDEHRRYVIG